MRSLLAYTLAGVALAILAGVLLIPLLYDRELVNYNAACVSAENDVLEVLIRQRQRTIDALNGDDPDPVLIGNLAMSQSHMVPANAPIIYGSLPTEPISIYMTEPPQCKPPDKPSQWLTNTAVKLRRDGIRRGLLVLAMGTLIAAMFLFHPAGIEFKR